MYAARERLPVTSGEIFRSHTTKDVKCIYSTRQGLAYHQRVAHDGEARYKCTIMLQFHIPYLEIFRHHTLRYDSNISLKR